MSNLKVSSVRFVLAAALLSITVSHLWGQGATATVLGTVTDSSGAGVPGAAVQVKNTQTGVNQTVTSDAQGRYRVADVAVGAYEVQASQAGFSTLVHKGIVLTVGAQVVVDFALPVGQQQQTVTVEGQVQEVETTNAAIGSYTSQQQMADLPLNGRNFEQLIMLSPGVTPVAWGYAPLQGRAEQYSIAGARPEGQAIMLDDDNLQSFWNNGMGSVTGSSLGVEAIGEFQTLTNAYGAQFGGNGSVINAVSKSGTNDFHGSAFDYLRNSVLDARDFFSTGKFGNSYTPPFRRNQFGGSIGGPIKKDKLFFFADYEGIQQLKEENALATVPNCTGGIGPTAPICTVTATNPTAATAVIQTLRLYPAPQTLTSPTATTGHAVTYGSQLNHENYGLFRIDYNINEKDSVFIRYFNDTADFTEPFGGGNITGGGAIPTWTEVDGSAANYAVLEERHLFSPTVVNVGRFSFSRPTKESNEATIAAPDAPGGTLPIGSAPCGTAVTYCPQTPLQFWPQYFGQPVIDGIVQPSGLSSVGGAQSEVFNLVQNRYTEGDDLLWTHGAHSFHFGAYLDRSQANTWNPHKEDMIWTFSSLTNLLAASAPGVEGVNPSPTNNPYRDYRQIDFVPYAQDDWKVSQKLTVNLGLRWEFATNPVVLDNTLYEVANIATSTNYSPFSHIFSANPSWTNFDPRVGVAYDPFADHKTAIRAGFGMFHDPVNPLDYQVGLQSAPPFEDQKTSAAQVYPFGFASGTPGLPTATSGWNRSNNATPYMIQYNASVQREVLPNTVLTVAYVGSRGIHLFSGIEANPPIPTITNGVYTFGTLGATSVNPNPRLNPNFGTFVDFEPISYSEYNALQVMLNHRFSQSLTAQVNYTWSQCLGDGENALGNLISTDGVPGSVENPFNQSIDKGPCSFDLPQVLRVNALYALPFKANRVVSGWQLSGIVTRLSGQPMNVSDGFDQVGLQAGDTPRPNYIAGCNPYAGAGTITEWFNTVSSQPGQSGCYSVQAPGTLGDVGRDTLRGPGFFDFDLAVLKDTKITERLRMQFRAEFFNIFNHENFAAPPSALFTAAIAGGVETIKTNPAAGVITSTNEGSTPRQIQFAVKFLF